MLNKLKTRQIRVASYNVQNIKMFRCWASLLLNLINITQKFRLLRSRCTPATYCFANKSSCETKQKWLYNRKLPNSYGTFHRIIVCDFAQQSKFDKLAGRPLKFGTNVDVCGVCREDSHYSSSYIRWTSQNDK